MSTSENCHNWLFNVDVHARGWHSSQHLSGAKWASIKMKLNIPKAPSSLKVSEPCWRFSLSVLNTVIASSVWVDMIVLYLHTSWQLENKVLRTEITELTQSNDFWSESRQETVDKRALADPWSVFKGAAGTSADKVGILANLGRWLCKNQQPMDWNVLPLSEKRVFSH